MLIMFGHEITSIIKGGQGQDKLYQLVNGVTVLQHFREEMLFTLYFIRLFLYYQLYFHPYTTSQKFQEGRYIFHTDYIIREYLFSF